MTNPYRLPNKPNLLIMEVLAWIHSRKVPVMMSDVADHFDITEADASVRLLKLHRWGYLRRKKRPLPPRVYEYTVSRFGRKTVTKL